MTRFPIELWPPTASTSAERVDRIFAVLSLGWLFIAGAIMAIILFLAIRYRKENRVDRTNPLVNNRWLETAWIAIPLVTFLGLFLWSATLFTFEQQAPANSLEIYVVGKQWMWKVQHPEGRREINELHVPVGQPIRLIMTSEDVIHSFFVPAFRLKMDVLPGRYTSQWFQATRPGRYHLFCGEYCGPDHAVMGGVVEVMAAADYASWLYSGTPQAPGPATGSGQALYVKMGCASCHGAEGAGTPSGPNLRSLIGHNVKLASGESLIADEKYLRESILDPLAKATIGYPLIMPSYKGQLREEEILRLIAYLKTLRDANPQVAPSTGGTP
jgi:cytochrome c oxidase subunit 2